MSYAQKTKEEIEMAKAEALAKIQYVSNVRKQIAETFKRFDKDGNGVLDRKEIKCAITELDKETSNFNLTEEEIDAMIDNLDRNGDGQIDFMEFLNLIMEM